MPCDDRLVQGGADAELPPAVRGLAAGRFAGVRGPTATCRPEPAFFRHAPFLARRARRSYTRLLDLSVPRPEPTATGTGGDTPRHVGGTRGDAAGTGKPIDRARCGARG